MFHHKLYDEVLKDGGLGREPSTWMPAGLELRGNAWVRATLDPGSRLDVDFDARHPEGISSAKAIVSELAKDGERVTLDLSKNGNGKPGTKDVFQGTQRQALQHLAGLVPTFAPGESSSVEK
jgi:hypothetical protein